MVGESNQNVFLIEIDASSLAEFETSEFEISRLDFIICDVVWENLTEGQKDQALEKKN